MNGRTQFSLMFFIDSLFDESNIFSLLVICSISVCVVFLFIYILGITVDERKFVKAKIRQIIYG